VLVLNLVAEAGTPGKAVTDPNAPAVVAVKHLPDGRTLTMTRHRLSAQLVPELMDSDRNIAAPRFDGMVGEVSGVDAVEIRLSHEGSSDATVFAELVRVYPLHDRIALMDARIDGPYLLVLLQRPPAVFHLAIVPLSSEAGLKRRDVFLAEADWNPILALAAPINWLDPKLVEMAILGRATEKGLKIRVIDRRWDPMSLRVYELEPKMDGLPPGW
jgi:hypothetical protein